jgi:hypothetical protein
MADADSRRCPKCAETKPLSMFGGGYCRPCQKSVSHAYYVANKEKVKQQVKAWRVANPEKYLAMNKAYYQATREESIAYAKEWAKHNPDRRKVAWTRYRQEKIEHVRGIEAAYRQRNRDECNARIAEWKKRNPHKITHYFHKRRAAELQATPAWADFDAIEAVYAEAQRIQAQTGVPQHVDHIVPLLSKLVCGLHCEANLRVIPASENNRKNNRHWPDMP